MTAYTLDKYSGADDSGGCRLPWRVFYRGEAIRSSHGIYSGWKCFGSEHTAKRWCESHLPRWVRAMGWMDGMYPNARLAAATPTNGAKP